MIRMDKSAAVYTRTGAAGFSTLAASGLRSGLRHLTGGLSGPDRSSLAERRHFQWEDSAYVLPYPCQIEVDGIRWQPLRETLRTITTPGGALQGRSCDVVRVLA